MTPGLIRNRPGSPAASGGTSHGCITELHKVLLVIERVLDGSAFFMTGLVT